MTFNLTCASLFMVAYGNAVILTGDKANRPYNGIWFMSYLSQMFLSTVWDLVIVNYRSLILESFRL